MGLISHIVKPAGDKAAWEHRHLTLHGSSAARGMNKWGGQLRRSGEKPNGSSGPKGGKK